MNTMRFRFEQTEGRAKALPSVCSGCIGFSDQHRFRVFAVDLETVAGGVGDYYPTVLCDFHSARCPQHLLWSEITNPVPLPDHVWVGL